MLCRVSIDETSTVATPVEVGLFLNRRTRRQLRRDPSRIAFGALRMHSWQIFPIEPRSEHFASHDGYLLKINYDLALEPEVPGPAWFEIAFASPASAAGEEYTVVDAIPGCTLEPSPPNSYALDQFLAFVPGDGIQLPATRPIIDLFGVGGPEVRWRHTASNGTGVRAGSYTCWATLVVPADSPELTIEVSARFDLALDSAEAHFYTPADDPTAVVLALRDSAPYTGAADRSVGSDTIAAAARVPRVFVSYTHDNSEHTQAVLRLSTFLAEDCGLDVHMDRWDLDRRRDWSLWAINQITAADFVIVIASPQCRAAANWRVDNLANRGMQSELALLREQLHSDRQTWLPKLLPVVLPGRSVEEIPLFLQPGVADHYIVSDLTIEGAEDLLRVITRQPRWQRPQPNPTVVHLPTRPTP